MHAWNLVVKDGQVTGIIDWQSTWTGPLFVQYRYPKIVHYPGDVEHRGEVNMRHPEDYKSMEEDEKIRVVSHQVERSLV